VINSDFLLSVYIQHSILSASLKANRDSNLIQFLIRVKKNLLQHLIRLLTSFFKCFTTFRGYAPGAGFYPEMFFWKRNRSRIRNLSTEDGFPPGA
jgi:hypothetical protein